MILITSSLPVCSKLVCTTRRIAPGPIAPRVMKRSSSLVRSVPLCEGIRIIKHQRGGLEAHAVFASVLPVLSLRSIQSAWYRPKVAGQFLTHQQTRIYVKYVQLSIQTAGPAPIVL